MLQTQWMPMPHTICQSVHGDYITEDDVTQQSALQTPD